jgi:hypothetical protein
MSGAATHPGGGVQGGPGSNAAQVMLLDLRVKQATEKVADGLDGLAARVRRFLR